MREADALKDREQPEEPYEYGCSYNDGQAPSLRLDTRNIGIYRINSVQTTYISQNVIWEVPDYEAQPPELPISLL